MPNARTATQVQDEILDAITVSQKATVNAYRTWAETVAKVTPTMFEFVSTPKVDNPFGFAEKFVANQRDFFVSMCEATAPMADLAPETARRASAEAGRATAAAKS